MCECSAAKLNELDPKAYLGFLLERIAKQRINRLDELLRWNYVRELARDDRLAA